MTDRPDFTSRSNFLTRHGYLFVAVPPVLILSTALLLFDGSATMTMGDFTKLVQSLAEQAQPVSLSRTLTEVRARYIWLASVVLNMTVPVGAAILCGLIMYRAHSRRRLLLVAAVGAVLCLGGVLVLLQSIATQGALYRSVFAFTYLTLEASTRFSPTFLAHVHSLVSIINGLAVVVPVIAVLAACSALAPPEDDRALDLDSLADRMRSLKEVLYAGSAILVTGILHMGNWLRWPAALLGDQTIQDGVVGVALAVSLFWGATFTLVLFATYAPAAGVLATRARARLRDDAYRKTIPHPEQWLKEHGFFVGISEELPQIVVMAAPLLAGPLGALLAASVSASR